jgi:cytochrome c-type biogenesis protein CcmH
MSRLFVAFLLAFACFASTAALAVQPDERLPDAGQESRARTLSGELRCMVCQNQSIDDSDADLARDLRLLVRERIRAGDGDEEALEFIVARYGEFVLLKPRWNMRNALLWGAPVLLLLIGGATLAIGAKRSRAGQAPLSADEEARLAALLERGGP